MTAARIRNQESDSTPWGISRVPRRGTRGSREHDSVLAKELSAGDARLIYRVAKRRMPRAARLESASSSEEGRVSPGRGFPERSFEFLAGTLIPIQVVRVVFADIHHAIPQSLSQPCWKRSQ